MNRYAIISVWNKTGVAELAATLVRHGYNILSTGGTYRAISESFDEVQSPMLRQVSDYTGSPEILDGRVKTLHPKIHAGILARADQKSELVENGVEQIALVVCNLYPFVETVESGADRRTVLENIDIGGPTMIRAAAKNYPQVAVVTDPSDYKEIINALDTRFTISETMREKLAIKAFSHVARYDIAIAQYFGDVTVRGYTPTIPLKYGCNPYQGDAALCSLGDTNCPIKVLNGKVGYINLIDAILGYQLVAEAAEALEIPVAASYKHTSPAGVGSGLELGEIERRVFDLEAKELTPTATAFARARNCDPLSSFGDFIAISHTVDVATAELIRREVSDGVIAPSFEQEALEMLISKKGGKFIVLESPPLGSETLEYRELGGMALCQQRNNVQISADDLKSVTKHPLPVGVNNDHVLANITLKYTQSNSVAFAYAGQVIGIGAGQQNRVDCVKLAGKKAERWVKRFEPKNVEYFESLSGSRTEKINKMWEYLDTRSLDSSRVPLSLASDAFFPFPDSIIVANQYNAKYISQPGGSIGDEKVIAECDKLGIMMAFTGKRLFLH